MSSPLEYALSNLPHGPEFRFIDRLIALEPGVSGTADYKVRDDLFLKGHFPGQPLFPGVLLIEAAAQLAGTVAQSDPQVKPLEDLRLAGVRKIKITGTAKPGETIDLRARITARMGGLIQAEVAAEVAATLVLEGEITLSGVVSGQD
jgi:3-hydroxyacyl-[acyl-carrier-protein] dehydratase